MLKTHRHARPEFCDPHAKHGVLYTELGDFQRAEQSYAKALSAQSRETAQDSVDYAKMINNFGKYYRKKGDHQNALRLFEQTLTINNALHQENSNDYGYFINDYALSLFDLNRQAEAIQLLEKNLEASVIQERTGTRDFYDQQHFLARAYTARGQFEKALPLLETASKGMKNLLGNSHEDIAYVLKTLGQCYTGLHRLDDAVLSFEAANEIWISQLEKIFTFRSEQEQKQYVHLVKGNLKSFKPLRFTKERILKP